MPVLLGLDYGLRRTGIAVSDSRGRIALAVGTHVEGRDGSLLQRLRALADAHGATGVVIGWPLRTDGSEGDMTDRVRRFAGRVEADLGLPVTLLDERFSSQEADRWIRLRGRPATREERDTVAAQLILQTHLDRLATAAEEESW
jgi:putative holliday junction resolvase